MLIAYNKTGVKVAEGETEVSLSGLTPATKYAKGDFMLSRKVGELESAKVDVPAFETLPIVVTGVTLNKTTLAKIVGETEKLTATVAPANATDKTVTWTTSDAKIATVGADGTAKAIAVGSATITAKAGTKTATCVVTVKAPANEE
ncbi:Ig-like domain-containing protein [Brochothrix thermosphacta]|uniref:Ig-like domain-containing protein n=1 Tax=Brochothrix thermosphacta TaxID=2756 RepID=UPI00265D33E4|nr:Ig-like domain-containing protein [Brochothrix thermosphacta]WKK68291.1 Ig-like domain-containing protein [Brochothrix thermosphacta]